ncbi:chlorophyll synthase, chloroplastic-like [Arachis ipaensis]|uniref:chlorophyll synthase, chloroplastic-like n=1 Tax=Arachis ipaensis TaxID=130454 RepID=UPI0007AF1CD2|nr:chlorophyll synthase, chloroplastic-like [Arachis ipaensis]XP_025633781.1 chlorophyll synthase, chloroplastic-like isoform X1 [Arachis hypogaea]XP_025633782.1 chlorophyll synthase, chloroplastic-like isoform X1 [Arachis hypogaea]
MLSLRHRIRLLRKTVQASISFLVLKELLKNQINGRFAFNLQNLSLQSIRRMGHDFPIVFYLAVGGSLLSYIYSAPPLKLKQNGWIGNFALGASYISLPWWAGQALFGTLTSDIIVLTLLYSIAGLGIAIVNDFKSVEGDRALGLQSLLVAFGTETPKWICVGAIDINITQLSVAGIFIPPILRYLICIPRFFFVLMYIVLYLEIIHHTKPLFCIFIICGL